MTRYPLTVCDEAWCVLLDTGAAGSSTERPTLRGWARVRIDAIAGEEYRSTIVAASGGVVGHPVVCTRSQLYATTGLEHAKFGDEVGRMLSRNAAPDPEEGGPHVQAYRRMMERRQSLARWADDGGRA